MEEAIQKLYVEASSRCNLRCKMCFRHSWVGERFGDLDPAVFARVMDDPVLSAAETVFFGGMGEPLVHPALAEMASLASARGKHVELVTNGTLLTREKARELLAARVSRIWVSIDELYENYGKIQVGSDFGLVLENLEAFNELRHGTDVRLGMTAVVMRDNIASLRRIREFAEHFLADDLNLSHIIPNRMEDIEQALWPMCDVAAIKAVTDKIGYTWRFEGFDMGTEIPMFKFSARYKDFSRTRRVCRRRSCSPGRGIPSPDAPTGVVSLKKDTALSAGTGTSLPAWVCSTRRTPTWATTNAAFGITPLEMFTGKVSARSGTAKSIGLSVSAYMNSSMRPACSAAAASCWKKTKRTVSVPLRQLAAAASGVRASPYARRASEPARCLLVRKRLLQVPPTS